MSDINEQTAADDEMPANDTISPSEWWDMATDLPMDGDWHRLPKFDYSMLNNQPRTLDEIAHHLAAIEQQVQVTQEVSSGNFVARRVRSYR